MHQSKFCTKCYKSKCFCMIFRPMKYYRNNKIETITCMIFNVGFFKFIIFYFYIVRVSIRFCFDLSFV